MVLCRKESDGKPGRCIFIFRPGVGKEGMFRDPAYPCVITGEPVPEPRSWLRDAAGRVPLGCMCSATM